MYYVYSYEPIHTQTYPYVKTKHIQIYTLWHILPGLKSVCLVSANATDNTTQIEVVIRFALVILLFLYRVLAQTRFRIVTMIGFAL